MLNADGVASPPAVYQDCGVPAVVELVVATTISGNTIGGRVAGVWSAGTGDLVLPMGLAGTTVVAFGAAPGTL